MIKDRDQKKKALRLSAASRWFPQPEVDVDPGRGVGRASLNVTDLDVLSSIPDEFMGFRAVVFDCKTRAKESPVNRALWLAGVLQRINGEQGICILKKEAIVLDHRLMANRLKIIILAEDEFDQYASATCPNYNTTMANVADVDAWDQFLSIPSRFPKLESGLRFARSAFWMAESSADACRKTIGSLRSLHPELDPIKSEHMTLFFDHCALFARALAIVVCHIFRAYLLPASRGDLSDALLMMLYGGREAYEHRNELYKRVMAKEPGTQVPDLALPEWDRFVQLVRQLLDAPLEVQRTPLILREVGFSVLRGDSAMSFAKEICAESPQGARFALLIPSYLGRAANLPPEFIKMADDYIIPLIPTK